MAGTLWWVEFASKIGMRLNFGAAALFLAVIIAVCDANWVKVASDDLSGPEPRYSHGAVAVRDSSHPDHYYLFVTHGYYNPREPVWLEDTWAFSSRSSSWTSIGHVSASEHAPHARYGAPLVRIGDECLLYFGGDDGGHRSSHSYVWGSYKADAFTLDVKQFVASSGAVLPAWQPLHPASSITVEPRTLHAAASFAVNGVSGAVWFGGLVSKAGPAKDSKAIANTEEMLVAVTVPEAACGSSVTWVSATINSVNTASFNDFIALRRSPDRQVDALNDDLVYDLARHSASVVVDARASQLLTRAAVSGGLHLHGDVPEAIVTGWLYGGTRLHCSREPASSRVPQAPQLCTLDDLWGFTLILRGSIAEGFAAGVSWSQIERPVSATLPPARTHHAAAMLGRSMVVFAGALCSPSCVTYGDMFVFDTSKGVWSSLPLPVGAPVARYRHTFSMVPAANGTAATKAVLFGGESYNPAQYHRDVWEWTQQVSSASLEYEHEADAELEGFDEEIESSGTLLVIGGVVAVIGFVYFVLFRGGSRAGKAD